MKGGIGQSAKEIIKLENSIQSAAVITRARQPFLPLIAATIEKTDE
jgi:hypothetical protein